MLGKEIVEVMPGLMVPRNTKFGMVIETQIFPPLPTTLNYNMNKSRMLFPVPRKGWLVFLDINDFEVGTNCLKAKFTKHFTDLSKNMWSSV